jgi:hypothetical protein
MYLICGGGSVGSAALVLALVRGLTHLPRDRVRADDGGGDGGHDVLQATARCARGCCAPFRPRLKGGGEGGRILATASAARRGGGKHDSYSGGETWGRVNRGRERQQRGEG